MRTLGIKIIDDAGRKHICQDVKILAIVERDDASVEEIDLSNTVTAVYPQLKLGEVAKANLEVLITGFESRCEAEEIIATYLPKRRKPGFLRRIWDVTTFGSISGAKEQVSR